MRDHPLRARVLIVACAMLALVQSAAASQDAPTATAPPPEALGMADLEELAGPIALYPDELLANVLAASVYPDELKAAQEFVSKGGDTAKIAEQTWESPVKAMARIPDLLQFLVENIDWTTALGQAYIVQSKDLMAAIQSLRVKAKQNGALQTGEQVTVVEDGSTIIIEPSDPQVIYVPDYDPDVVYVDHHDSGDVLAAGLVGFGVGMFVGACFDDDFDCFWGGGHVGYGWGHSDVDIDRDVNIETGDINIGSGNEINRERNTERNSNRSAGREGQQWQPNSNKVDTNALRQPGGASKLGDFKGASTGQARGNARVPTQTTARPSRGSTGAGGAGAAGGARPSAGSGAGGARPSAGASAKPAPSSRAPSSARPSGSGAPSSARTSSTRAPSSKPPSASSGRVPAPKTSAPRAPSSATRSAPAQSRASGFSPSRGSSSASSRGSSSRSGSSRPSGGSRGGGGRGR